LNGSYTAGGPLTEWSEVDLLTCFESEPEIGEDRLSFHYVTERSGYRLSFTIWPYDEDIYVVLHGPSQSLPLLDVWLHACTAVRYAKSGEVESLSFRYRDLERHMPETYQSAELRVRPEFCLNVTR
jgi:hypothetical protein